MRSASQRFLCCFLVLTLMASVCTLVGCGPKPISPEVLDYFHGLTNTQYWQRQATGLALDDEHGAKQVVVAPTEKWDRQQYVVFGDVTVTKSDAKVGPVDAFIEAKVFDGATEEDARVRVDDANLATLQAALADGFESKTQRDQRLGSEAYAAKIKDADALIAEEKVSDAIVALKAAQAINDTDDVKTRLDAIYLKQGKEFYAEKKYDFALARLELVSFDSGSLGEAQRLLQAVQADAEKAAAEKAAAEKATVKQRTWFKTLDDCYNQFSALVVEMGVQNRYTMMPTADKMEALNDEIYAYCMSARGMDPPALDAMRTALWAYTGGEMTQIYRSWGALVSTVTCSNLPRRTELTSLG